MHEKRTPSDLAHGPQRSSRIGTGFASANGRLPLSGGRAYGNATARQESLTINPVSMRKGAAVLPATGSEI